MLAASAAAAATPPFVASGSTAADQFLLSLFITSVAVDRAPYETNGKRTAKTMEVWEEEEERWHSPWRSGEGTRLFCLVCGGVHPQQRGFFFFRHQLPSSFSHDRPVEKLNRMEEGRMEQNWMWNRQAYQQMDSLQYTPPLPQMGLCVCSERWSEKNKGKKKAFFSREKKREVHSLDLQ